LLIAAGKEEPACGTAWHKATAVGWMEWGTVDPGWATCPTVRSSFSQSQETNAEEKGEMMGGATMLVTGLAVRLSSSTFAHSAASC